MEVVTCALPVRQDRRVLLRPPALACVLTTAAALLTAAPASAAPSGHRAPGSLTPVYRSPQSPTPTGRAALRRASLVAGSPSATKQSPWQVTFDQGWSGHDDAKAAFQAAVDTWAGIVRSTVPIRVHADLKDLGDPSLLGQAGPGGYDNGPGVGDGSTYYPDALADALAGADNYPSDYDIYAEFNSGATDVYYGTDGDEPAQDVDFESIVLHELGHGLGFSGSSSYDPATGKGSFDCRSDSSTCSPSGLEAYDRFLQAADGTRLTTLADGSTALGTAYQSPLYWGGPNAVAANGGQPVQLYAPRPYEIGSSVAHLDEDAFPTGDVNALLTPFLSNGEVVHRPGPVDLGVFRDLGWTATLGVPAKVAGVSGTGGGGAVTLTWTRPADNGSGITGYRVSWTDDGVAQAPRTVSGTTTGFTGLDQTHTYVFTVAATNAVGTGPDSDPTPGITPGPDSTAPVVSTAALPAAALGASVGLRYAATDSGAGVASYDVRYRRAAFNAGFGALTYPSTWQATTATGRTTTATAGSTYCFSARARDVAGNTSAWSAERCTATPLDDRALAASTGWTRATSTASYLRTVTSTRASGRTLSRTAVRARRLSLVATTCSGCGTVGVYWNGTLLRKVSLNAAGTAYQHVIALPDFGAVRPGTLVVKTLNTGRTYVDGVVLSRV